MTDKEKLDKLVAEIERLIGDYDIKTEKYRGMNEQAHQYYGGKRDALSEILKSIDSMQEECNITGIGSKHATGKLKEVIDNVTKDSLAKARKQLEEESVNNGLDLGCGVIWKEEEPVSEDLEGAAKENAKIERPDDTEVGYDINRFGGFVDGANWQKQQMIDKAVDVTIAIPYPNGYGGYTQLVDSKKALSFGDKLKVLVIKED